MTDNINPVQFGKYTISHDDLRYRTIRADTARGTNIGYLMWEKPGEHNNMRPTITGVRVNKPQQHKGVAGAMLEHALQYEPNLQHQHALTPDGKRFAARYPLP